MLNSILETDVDPLVNNIKIKEVKEELKGKWFIRGCNAITNSELMKNGHLFFHMHQYN